MKTQEEIKATWATMSTNMSLKQPKGVACTNISESRVVDDLDRLIGVADHMRRKHLTEFRKADIAYSLIGSNEDDAVFIADQVKTGRVNTIGTLKFHANNNMLSVANMISILKNGSLTCIGLTRDGIVDVVWFFTSIKATHDTLLRFNMDQTFHPVLHLSKKSTHPFTVAMQSERFRFDVGKSKAECDRLLKAKIEFLAIGKKRSLNFWNTDYSQIPSKNHQVEQRSMDLLRNACVANAVNFEKTHEIMYGKVDFLIGNARVQDKAIYKPKRKAFNNRSNGGLPYNPDDIDVFQVTDIKDKIGFAMSTRVLQRDGTVTSFFSVENLMKENIKFGPQWKELHKAFKHDLNTPEGTKSYVDACIAAGKIPPLTDRAFYSKMCDDNQNKFGSKKEMAKRKKNANKS